MSCVSTESRAGRGTDPEQQRAISSPRAAGVCGLGCAVASPTWSTPFVPASTIVAVVQRELLRRRSGAAGRRGADVDGPTLSTPTPSYAFRVREGAARERDVRCCPLLRTASMTTSTLSSHRRSPSSRRCAGADRATSASVLSAPARALRAVRRRRASATSQWVRCRGRESRNAHGSTSCDVDARRRRDACRPAEL